MRQLGTTQPRAPVDGSEVGLSSLRSTVGKLEDDASRHRGNLGQLCGRMASCHQKNKEAADRYLRKSFDAKGYHFLKTLGAGRHGEMKLARRTPSYDGPAVIPWEEHPSSTSSSLVAVRVIQRFTVDPHGGHLRLHAQPVQKETYPTLLRHLRALQELDHPGIQRVHEIFEDSQYIYAVMHLHSGGDILSREVGAMPEVRAAQCMAQLCSAMAHAHERGLVHQDLRPQNLLYDTQDQDARLVVTNWDCCEYVSTPPEKARRNLAITDFSAPELRSETRSDRGDVWSIGVIAFLLVAGRLPYLSGTLPQDFMWSEQGADCEAEAHFRDFISRLLRVKPEQRLPARGALAHPWLQPPQATSTPAGDARPLARGSTLGVGDYGTKPGSTFGEPLQAVAAR